MTDTRHVFRCGADMDSACAAAASGLGDGRGDSAPVRRRSHAALHRLDARRDLPQLQLVVAHSTPFMSAVSYGMLCKGLCLHLFQDWSSAFNDLSSARWEA